MERVQVLIDKLSTQKATNDTPAQLLTTVQLLHQELLSLQVQVTNKSSTKVAVVMPVVYPVNTVMQEPVVESIKVSDSKEVKQPIPLVEPKEEKPMFQQQSFFDIPQPEPVQTMTSPTVQEAYSLKKPAVSIPEPVREEVKPQQPTAVPFDVLAETPTLSYRQPQKEIHELIGTQEASLNDKLKAEKTELAHALKDAPIKDLRKGIGVNDKFLFINELFRGDESLYEKSIKTINAFHILPEAEYWINRELKMRLAWNDNKEVVQHFYQLVRRRFS
jgi:hypothetical protein